MTANTTDTAHQGNVLAHYRKLNKWPRSKLAEILGVDISTVYRMEKHRVIKNPERRRLLVGLLGIPATLMGLDGEPQPSTIHLMLNDDRMAFFEHEMATRWDVYRTGGTTRAYRGLNIWLKEAETFAQEARGTMWHDRAHTLLSLSYQLQGSIFGDMMQYDQAHIACAKALHIAEELHDPELQAAAFARRGVTYIQQNMPIPATEYLNAALKLVSGLGLPCLRGYVLKALSEACAMAQQAGECWRNIDLAQRTLERKGEVLERGYFQLNATSITAQKGVNAVLLHDNDYAITLIDKGLMRYDHTFIRGRARLLAQKAEAYYALGWIEMSATTAEEAWALACSVGSHKTHARVRNLHTAMAQSRWGKESCVARLGVAIAIQ